MEGSYLLEQPRSSLMLEYPRMGQVFRMLKGVGSKALRLYLALSVFKFRTTVANLCLLSKPVQFSNQAYRVFFWMRSYNHRSMKRTMVVANDSRIMRLDQGRLAKKLRDTAQPACRSYKDRNGKRRYHGGATLKATQCLISNLSLSTREPNSLSKHFAFPKPQL